MRISCDFKVSKLPVSYNMMFVSIIKEALKASNEEYYKSLYSFKEDKQNKKTKNFTFAVFINGFEKKGDNFKVNGNVTLTVSSPDHEFMIYLYNGFSMKKKYKYKEYELGKIRFMVIEEKKVLKNEVIVKGLSPICIKDKQNKFLQIEDPEFKSELNYISNVVLKNYRGYGLNKKLEFEVLDYRKRVVKEKIRNFKEVTNKDVLYVNAYVGIFKLKGSREDLNDLYKLGIGNRRSQGFGMIDIY